MEFGHTTAIATCACKGRCQKEKASYYVTIFLFNKQSFKIVIFENYI